MYSWYIVLKYITSGEKLPLALQMGLKALHMLGKCPTTEPHPQPRRKVF
jgi:hypothetical protein